MVQKDKKNFQDRTALQRIKWYFMIVNRMENGTFCLSKTLASARISNYGFGGTLKNPKVVKEVLNKK